MATTYLGTVEAEVARVFKRLRAVGCDESLAAVLAEELVQDFDTIVDTSGNYIYVASAPSGTAAGVAGWQVQRIDTSTLAITWADGNTNFDNVATSLSSLSYS